ncbi:Serine/threonine protein kinase [Handroanthus impetiginosus]|uniref:non-specific serine/threonine protein kinase n=1 Tax=Handroanthus impetiginosus TaxID=429701 RepID=A0A2G9HCP5_9LAMI|nr:Serine/threonine protein kinase [Handroanthus impetiginosus]
MGNLSPLEILSIESSSLTGNVPSSILNISSLKILNLANNSLSGSISVLDNTFFNLPKLEQLHLDQNHFTGQIVSTNILRSKKLWLISLEYNKLTGSIPKQLGNLTSVKILYMGFNYLTGEIPRELVAIRLVEFDAIQNFLSGSIPSFIFNISTLGGLSLSYNHFSGSLPSIMGPSLPNLEWLLLSHNMLSGLIPSFINNASKLIELSFSNNSFSGSVPNFGNLRLLQKLGFWGNNLTGGLGFLSSLTTCQYLQTLDISNNPLNDILPTSIGNLSSTYFQWFGATKCNIKGFIPLEIGNLSSLLSLIVNKNELIGFIPSTIGKLKRLQRMILNGNRLEGHIPLDLCQITNLGDLHLGDNMLTDLVTLILSSNYFSGQLLSGIGSLAAINQVDLSIEGCRGLETLSLANNEFEGSIPGSLGNVRGLSKLDLSNNKLSGSIPKSLENLRFLVYFNVSYNRLEGEIPTTDLLLPLLLNHLFQILLYVVLQDSRRISHRELLQGTKSFSETNLLGRGSFCSVFKGTLFDGLNVAVKVFNLQLEGAAKSFDTESEILSTVRHKNLVRIIGCCSNLEFKALILAYMPNGSLEKWLYSDNYCLNVIQRLKIIIDVALALEYLHHGHTFPVVHCDIKPSNVLLDEDMTAHVGDFGIAKLFDEGEVVIQTKTLATIGYASPEYGSEGRVSTNGDVYSYGVVLLEIFTRKKPTDDMFSEYISLKDWVSRALQENAIIRVVDPCLLASEDQDQHFSIKEEHCVSSIFGLAMKCLAVSPKERINMIETVASLQKIKAQFQASH